MASAFDIIEVVVEGLLFGQKILNVYHALSPDAVTDGHVTADIGAGIEAVIGGILTDMVVNDYTLDTLKIKNLTENTIVSEGGFPTLTGGVSGADVLPTGACAVLTLPTDAIGTRGRKFIAGVDETLTSNSLFTSTVTDALDAMGAALVLGFVGDASGSPWAWGVVDKTGSFKKFTGSTSSNIPGYQRRRKQGVGD